MIVIILERSSDLSVYVTRQTQSSSEKILTHTSIRLSSNEITELIERLHMHGFHIALQKFSHQQVS